MSGEVGCLAGHDIERALAASERVLMVTHAPEAKLQARLDHALLLYHASVYDDAWTELGALREEVAGTDAELSASLEVLYASERGAHHIPACMRSLLLLSPVFIPAHLPRPP